MRPYNTIATIYVSSAAPGGLSGQSPVIKDDGDGPFPSIEAAINFIAELRRSGTNQPITVRLLPGEYPLANTLKITPAIYNVTFESLTGKPEDVIISGGRKLTGFSETEFNGKKCLGLSIPEVKEGKWDFSDLYVNGLRADYSRYPETGFLKFKAVENNSTELFAPSKWAVVNKEDVAGLSAESIKNSVVSYLHYWIDEHSPVEDYDPESGKLTMSYLSRFNIVHNCDYYFENVRETFGAPGQWYLDRAEGMLYYVPRDSSETAETLDVHAPVVAHLIDFTGTPANKVSNIRFREVTFAYTRGDYLIKLGTHGENGDVCYSSDSQAVSNAEGTINMEYTRNCAIAKCRFVNFGIHGINVNRGCEDIRIAYDTFYDGGASGIKITGSDASGAIEDRTHDNAVSDCTIKHCGRRYMAACGVLLMHTYSNRIAHNEICDLYYTGISGGWVWGYSDSVTRDNLIIKNHIHDLGQGMLSDMGGVYLLGAQPGTVVSGNLIHDIKSRDYGGWALYTDEGSGYVTLENNICYNCSDNCYHQHYGRMNAVRNNIFAFAGKELCRVSRFEGHLSIIFQQNIFLTDGCPVYGMSRNHLNNATVSLGDNLIWKIDGGEVNMMNVENKKLLLDDFKKLGLEQDTICGNPKFTDAKNYDFTLAKDSPAYAIGFKPIDMHDVGPRK